MQNAPVTSWHLTQALTDDGRRVFFTTGEPLLPEDTNSKNDVYQYDVPTGALHLVTSGQDPSDSYFLEASSDGSDVFFVTRERLVGWDDDTSYDLYDARVGGGFPEPAAPAPRCSGSACQGGAGPQPAASRVGSNLDGSGDLAAVLKPHRAKRVCKRGFVKKRVRGNRRCVKRARHHERRGANRAGVKVQRRAK